MAKQFKSKRLAADRTKSHLGAIRVMNNTGSEITKDSIVRVSGSVASGGILRIVDASVGEAGTLLVAGHDIADGQDGIAYEWAVTTLDTSASAVDEGVYLSATDGAVSLTASGPRVGSVLTVGSSGFVLLAPGSQAGDGYVEVKGLVASAALLTLFTTPVAVLAAPGAGLAWTNAELYGFLDHGGTDYTAAAGEDLQLIYATSGDLAAVTVDDAVIDGASGDIYFQRGPENGAVSVNEGLSLKVATGNWADGDGDLKYRVRARLVKADPTA